MSDETMVALTPRQVEVALQKVIHERERERWLPRLLRALAQLQLRLAAISALSALLFLNSGWQLPIGLVVVAVLFLVGGALQEDGGGADDEGPAAARRMGLWEKIERDVQQVQPGALHWLGLLPLYVYLLIAQFTDWPRPWWLITLLFVLVALVFYNRLRRQIVENDYYTSIIQLERELKVGQREGDACLSEREVERLWRIEQRQTQRQVVKALEQTNEIPLSHFEAELWSTMRAAYHEREQEAKRG